MFESELDEWGLGWEQELGSCPHAAGTWSRGPGELTNKEACGWRGPKTPGQALDQGAPLGKTERRQLGDLSRVDEAEQARLTQEPVEFSSHGSR